MTVPMRIFLKLHGIDVSVVGNVVAAINLLPPAQNRLASRYRRASSVNTIDRPIL